MTVGKCPCCGMRTDRVSAAGLCPNCDAFVGCIIDERDEAEAGLACYRARFCAADQAVIEDPTSLWPEGCWRDQGVMHEGQAAEAASWGAADRSAAELRVQFEATLRLIARNTADGAHDDPEWVRQMVHSHVSSLLETMPDVTPLDQLVAVTEAARAYITALLPWEVIQDDLRRFDGGLTFDRPAAYPEAAIKVRAWWDEWHRREAVHDEARDALLAALAAAAAEPREVQP